MAEVVGVGISLGLSDVEFSDLVVRDIHRHPRRVWGGAGIRMESASVHARGLQVLDSAGGGIFHVQDESDGEPRAAVYEDLVAEGNGGTGLAVLGVDAVAVTGGRFNGQTGDPDFGDGIQVLGPIESLALRGLEARGNPRVGVLVDLGGETLREVEVADVTVESADSLGFVVQNGEVPAGTEDGVTRLGAAEANDAAHDGELRTYRTFP